MYTPLLTPARRVHHLPDHYFSHVQTSDKILFAHDLAYRMREAGYTPVAATVTGSTLRGLDTPDSDMDGTVVVLDKKVNGALLGPDVAVVTLDKFFHSFTTSLPFVEVQRSPFLLVDPRYRAFFASMCVDKYRLGAHVHTMARRRVNEDDGGTWKAYRQLVGMWHTSTTGSPLVPRDFIDPEFASPEFVGWFKTVRGW